MWSPISGEMWPHFYTGGFFNSSAVSLRCRHSLVSKIFPYHPSTFFFVLWDQISNFRLREFYRRLPFLPFFLLPKTKPPFVTLASNSFPGAKGLSCSLKCHLPFTVVQNKIWTNASSFWLKPKLQSSVYICVCSCMCLDVHVHAYMS